jgi:hypothetical protein
LAAVRDFESTMQIQDLDLTTPGLTTPGLSPGFKT